MSTESKTARPDCFGDLECVFPMGKNGLRHSPDTCMACDCKTVCLQTALQGGGGLQLKEETVDRAYHSGLIGFWKRWSQKKTISLKKAKQ